AAAPGVRIEEGITACQVERVPAVRVASFQGLALINRGTERRDSVCMGFGFVVRAENRLSLKLHDLSPIDTQHVLAIPAGEVDFRRLDILDLPERAKRLLRKLGYRVLLLCVFGL